MIVNVIQTYEDIQSRLNLSETAAALLVLGEVITQAAAFNRENAENFGHELALALKAAIGDSVVHAEVVTQSRD